MNINTKNLNPTRQRKQRHLDICTDPSRYTVDSPDSGFESIHFYHHVLPELSEEDIDSSIDFLGYTISFPFLISCMTGGSEGAFKANKELGRAANELGLAVGMGSIRVLFEHPELFEQFYLREHAPKVPVLANIGGAQIRDIDQKKIIEMTRRLEADSLVVHLNPGQELFQPEGDRNFKGIEEALYRLFDKSPFPVIIKETGFGIDPETVERLLAGGAAYIDLGAAGGTNWIRVESYRLDEREQKSAEEFSDWGMPLPLLLASLQSASSGPERNTSLIASGGIRSGMDIAKSLAMGAELTASALPLIRAVYSGGSEAVISLVSSWKDTVKRVMLLTASRTLTDLRRGKIWYEPGFAETLKLFKAGAYKTGG